MKPLRKQVGWDVVRFPYNNTRMLSGWILDRILEETQRSVEGYCDLIDHEGTWLTEALYNFYMKEAFNAEIPE